MFEDISAQKYLRTFLSIGTKELAQIFSQMPEIRPVVINRDTAQYRFDQIIQGQTITFPIEFVKENGTWKIMEY